jgi:phosphatidate cytidylyltransferase
MLGSIFYISSGFVFLTLIPFINLQFIPELIICIFILIWANDTFAYLVGKSLGKHKLMERISPKKTIEGFVGGLLGAIITSLIIFNFTEYYSVFVWVAIALLISVFGTLGDLIQSKFKRKAGVKDSGRLMPGHGGLYDRLDSVIYSSPFIYLFLQIINYVS